MALACQPCGSGGRGGLRKGQWPLPNFLSGRKLFPALTLMPDTSVPSGMLPVTFKLLSRCWSSERVNLRESESHTWNLSEVRFWVL